MKTEWAELMRDSFFFIRPPRDVISVLMIDSVGTSLARSGCAARKETDRQPSLAAEPTSKGDSSRSGLIKVEYTL